MKRKTQEKIIVKENSYQERMSWDLVDQWADGIPVFSENNPDVPEWKETPTFPLNLALNGYGFVYVKNEADKECNPTQTIKDRPAWELATIYRDYARSLALRKSEINGGIDSFLVPRFTYITAGNIGRSISYMFEKYRLPPMKLLIGNHVRKEVFDELRKLNADVYLTDLRAKLDTGEIKRLTNNIKGVDITSNRMIRPQELFYDWHVHEAFNQNPDEIYVPYGSGRLYENYLTWQEKSFRQGISGNKDPRLKIPLERIIKMDILGASPKKGSSRADKLSTHYNPFRIFDDQDITASRALALSGRETGVYKISDDKILAAYEILNRYCECEPSSVAGLALYLQRYEEGKIDPRDKILIINTGKGI